MTAAALRRHLLATSCFCAMLLVSLFAQAWLPDGIIFAFAFTVGVPLAAVIALLALALVLRGLWMATRSEATAWQRAATALSAPAVLATTFCLALPTIRAGNWLAAQVHLATNLERYQHIVEATRSSKDSEPWRHYSRDGIDYRVDPGPPIRIAFEPEGFLDNWSGIVFDPTGDVMQTDGFEADGKFAAPERITRLFGGDLVRCRHLTSDFYLCSFT